MHTPALTTKTNDEEKIRALAYSVYDAINARNIALMRQLFSSKVIRHAMGEIGLDGGIELMNKTFEECPETRFVVEDVLVEGNKAALRVSIHGQPASSEKPLPLILEIFRFENNQIVEVWGASISSDRFPQ